MLLGLVVTPTVVVLSRSIAVDVEFATSAGRKECTTPSDPSETIVTCTGELYNPETGRFSPIAFTENGVSTAAIKNPAAYMSPWSYLTETSDAAKAWQSLTYALQYVEPNVQIETLTLSYHPQLQELVRSMTSSLCCALKITWYSFDQPREHRSLSIH